LSSGTRQRSSVSSSLRMHGSPSPAPCPHSPGEPSSRPASTAATLAPRSSEGVAASAPARVPAGAVSCAPAWSAGAADAALLAGPGAPVRARTLQASCSGAGLRRAFAAGPDSAWCALGPALAPAASGAGCQPSLGPRLGSTAAPLPSRLSQPSIVSSSALPRAPARDGASASAEVGALPAPSVTSPLSGTVAPEGAPLPRASEPP